MHEGCHGRCGQASCCLRTGAVNVCYMASWLDPTGAGGVFCCQVPDAGTRRQREPLCFMTENTTVSRAITLHSPSLALSAQALKKPMSTSTCPQTWEFKMNLQTLQYSTNPQNLNESNSNRNPFDMCCSMNGLRLLTIHVLVLWH